VPPPPVPTPPDGVEFVNVKSSFDDVSLVPDNVVTVTCTVPVPAGLTATILVEDFTLKLRAAVAPNMTFDVPRNPVPAMVTFVPPRGVPDDGESDVTVGFTWYVKWSSPDFALVPDGVVTWTSTVPFEPSGLTTVSSVAETTSIDVPAVDPNMTVDAPIRFEPFTVTEVPPFVGPAFGETLVTFGAPW
jgi:hypothetical protein